MGGEEGAYIYVVWNGTFSKARIDPIYALEKPSPGAVLAYFSIHSIILSASTSKVQMFSTLKPTESNSSRHCFSERSMPASMHIMLMSNFVM